MSDAEETGLLSKVIGPKKRWWAYKARVKQLPESHRAAVDAIERYLMLFVPADGDSASAAFEDLADLFEQAAVEGTSVRDVVGDDPVEFVSVFAQNYSRGGYIPDRERERLIKALDRAAAEDEGRGGKTL
ncbi:DUF1048 domain-containing protein [Streptomyces sp. NPDC059002]|uniref:DUF1048 domain-containing protein n=1 Tax=Streptomyces sp. NPDC059002 TaxID=3346690 RepID=UPI00368A0BAF